MKKINKIINEDLHVSLLDGLLEVRFPKSLEYDFKIINYQVEAKNYSPSLIIIRNQQEDDSTFCQYIFHKGVWKPSKKYQKLLSENIGSEPNFNFLTENQEFKKGSLEYFAFRRIIQEAKHLERRLGLAPKTKNGIY